MHITDPDASNNSDAINDLETAISLFRLIIPTYFDEIQEPLNYCSDRDHIGNALRAAEDYIISAKMTLKSKLERNSHPQKNVSKAIE